MVAETKTRDNMNKAFDSLNDAFRVAFAHSLQLYLARSRVES